MKTSKNMTLVPVDGEALRLLFKKAGKTLGDVSQDMGRGYSYFSQRSRAGALYAADAVWLEAKMGIKPEQYAPVKKPPENLDLVNTRTVMKNAVREGINERFSDREFVNSLRDIVRPVVRSLLEEERSELIRAINIVIREVLE